MYFRSQLPRAVERCQGNCGIKLVPAEEQDYLVIKSYGQSTYTVNGECKSKYGPQYIHFNTQCLREYAYQKHNTYHDVFPLYMIDINKNTLLKLNEEEKENLESYGVITS